MLLIAYHCFFTLLKIGKINTGLKASVVLSEESLFEEIVAFYNTANATYAIDNIVLIKVEQVILFCPRFMKRGSQRGKDKKME